jgi:hypothetical protein
LLRRNLKIFKTTDNRFNRLEDFRIACAAAGFLTSALISSALEMSFGEERL